MLTLFCDVTDVSTSPISSPMFLLFTLMNVSNVFFIIINKQYVVLYSSLPVISHTRAVSLSMPGKLVLVQMMTFMTF